MIASRSDSTCAATTRSRRTSWPRSWPRAGRCRRRGRSAPLTSSPAGSRSTQCIGPVRRRHDPGRRTASSPRMPASATATRTCATGSRRRQAGGFRATKVATITLTDIRIGGPDRVREILAGLRRRPTRCRGHRRGRGPAGSGARLTSRRGGRQELHLPHRALVRPRPQRTACHATGRRRAVEADLGQPPADSDETRPATKHGLIAVGSHVGLTTRQLDRLRDQGQDHRAGARCPDSARRQRSGRHVDDDGRRRPRRCCRNNDADSDIVIRTSRTLVTGDDAARAAW